MVRKLTLLAALAGILLSAAILAPGSRSDYAGNRAGAGTIAVPMSVSASLVDARSGRS